jgi:hypothetical protein
MPSTWTCAACGLDTDAGTPGLYCEPCRRRISYDAQQRIEAFNNRRRARARARHHQAKINPNQPPL